MRRGDALSALFEQGEQSRKALFRQGKALFQPIKLRLLARQYLVEFRKGLFLKIILLFKPGQAIFCSRHPVLHR